MPVIDLNFSTKSNYTPVLLPTQEDMSNEYRQTRFLSSDRPFTALHISKLRQSLPRQLQSQKLHMSGSVPMHGFCTNDISREPTRHRSMSQSPKKQTLPHGNSKYSISQHIGQCQPNSRLAHLRRICSNADPNSTQTIPQRTVRLRIGKYSLRTGLLYHRPLSKCISPGLTSGAQKLRSNFIPSWICAATFLHSFISPTENCTTCKYWISSYRKPAAFTLWIAAIWISHDSLPYIKILHFSSSGPNPI